MKYEPFGAYTRKLGKYSLPFDSPKLSKDQVVQALREDGIKAESADAIRSAYTQQRDLILGRKATGAFQLVLLLQPTCMEASQVMV